LRDTWTRGVVEGIVERADYNIKFLKKKKNKNNKNSNLVIAIK